MAFWAGQAFAMGQYHASPPPFFAGPVATFVVQDNLNSMADTFQPAALRGSLPPTSSTTAPVFVAQKEQPFGPELSDFTNLLLQAGVKSIIDLKKYAGQGGDS